MAKKQQSLGDVMNPIPFTPQAPLGQMRMPPGLTPPQMPGMMPGGMLPGQGKKQKTDLQGVPQTPRLKKGKK